MQQLELTIAEKKGDHKSLELYSFGFVVVGPAHVSCSNCQENRYICILCHGDVLWIVLLQPLFLMFQGTVLDCFAWAPLLMCLPFV